MVIDFALPAEGDIAKGFKRYQEVTKRSVMDYGLHMAVTTWNEKVPCYSACSAFLAAILQVALLLACGLCKRMLTQTCRSSARLNIVSTQSQ